MLVGSVQAGALVGRASGMPTPVCVCVCARAHARLQCPCTPPQKAGDIHLPALPAGMPPVTNRYDESLAAGAYALATRWHTADVLGIGGGGPTAASPADIEGWSSTQVGGCGRRQAVRYCWVTSAWLQGSKGRRTLPGLACPGARQGGSEPRAELRSSCLHVPPWAGA